MNKIIKYITVISLVGFLFSGCSKLKEDLPAEVIGESIAHGPGFTTPGHPNFHGNLFIKAGTSMDQCKTCHGQTFTGGRTEVNCAKCHSGIPIHTNDSLLVPGSSNFHGFYFKASSMPLSSCRSCHGSEFQGKGAAISCSQCHSSVDVHKAGIVDPVSPNFHGKYFQTHSFNDLLKCKSCHGENFAGGMSAPECKTCHTQPNGPEACNTCHGNFSDPSKIAPPNDVAGNSAVTFRGVGAHEKHLYSAAMSKNLACAECHTPVTSVYLPSHLDNTPNAEVVFNGPVSKKTDTYDQSKLSCNTYCHGNFSFSKSQASVADQFAYTADAITGSLTSSPAWTSTGTAKCGTCHALPPKGHVGYPDQIPVTSCGSSGCHLNVVDASGNIINNGKHLNGARNVRGN